MLFLLPFPIGISLAGLASKNPDGLRWKDICSTGMIGQSSNLGSWKEDIVRERCIEREMERKIERKIERKREREREKERER